MKNKDSSQKIMYLNPVGFDAYDAFFAEMIKKHKFSNSDSHVGSLSSSVGQMDNLEYRTYNALIAIDQDGAESIILGCTLEFGFFEKIQNEFNVPVIDPSLAALKQAEQSAILKNQFGWKPSRQWSAQPPPENDISRFGLFKEDYHFGNRIIVK